MAGTTVPEIYCWHIKIEDLNIYLASSKRGALRVGLSLKEKQDSAAFFKKRFLISRITIDRITLINKALLAKGYRNVQRWERQDNATKQE